MKNTFQKPFYLVITLFLFSFSNLYATTNPTLDKKSLFSYLDENQFSEVVLTVDLDKLLNKKSK